jgi:hypothetical protein
LRDIIFNVDEPETRGTTRASRYPVEIVEEAKEIFEQALSKVCHVTEKIITTLRGLALWPNEIKLESGFSLNVAAGVMFDLASMQVSYKVTLKVER